MEPICTSALDDAFGPSVDNCRRAFDFTLLFEQSILSIPFSSFVLLLSCLRIWQLYGRRSRTECHVTLGMKMLTCTTLVALQLTLVIMWTEQGATKTRASIPSAVLSLLATFALTPLVWLEHTRSIRPSFLVGGYLILSTLLDIAQLRSLWLIKVSTQLASVFSATLTLRIILLLIESKNRAYVDSKDSLRSPEDKHGIVSRSFFFWLNGLLYTGYKQALVLCDLFPTSSSSLPEVLEARMAKSWSALRPGKKHRLLIATVQALHLRLFAALTPRLFMIGFTVCQPLLVLRMIRFLNERPESSNVGYGLIGAYALVYLGIAVSTSWFWHQHIKFTTEVRGALISFIYRKTLTFRASAIDKASSVTVMSADVERIVFGLKTIHDVWANFIQVAIAAWLLEMQTGTAVVAPLAIAIACAYGTIQIGNRAGGHQMEWLTRVQNRIGVTSSTLSSMRGVKMSGLTEKLLEMIQNLRELELEAAGRFRIYLIGSLLMGYVPVHIGPVITFAIFIGISRSQDLVLDTATMFTSLSFLVLISQPLSILFQSVPGIISMIRCFERIENYLDTPERNDTRQCISNHISEKGPFSDSLIIEQGAYGWDLDANPVIRDVNVKVPSGKLTLVIGPVGCGKSTLLKAILGEATSLFGKISITSASVAHCDQTPWLINGTLKENIEMFSVKEELYYDTVMHACGLDEDLSLLPNAGNSNLGSKGITLSGGQKQRVSLARAIFSRASLQICDDILSGLDSATELHVFSHVFGPRGLLKEQGATAVLATHSVKLLPYADYIICIGTEGTISEQGTFKELQAAGGYVSRLNVTESPFLPDITRGMSISHSSADDIKNSNQVNANEVAVHHKPHGVYRYYIRSVGKTVCLIYLGLGLMNAFFFNFPYIWAKWWSDENQRDPGSREPYYMGLYAMFQVLALTSLALICWHGVVTVVTYAGRSLHLSVLATALAAPLSFYEKTDTGTTLNRFGQDMQMVDTELPMALMNVMYGSLALLGQLLLIINASYFLAISLPVIGLFMWALQKVYLRTSRRLRHLELETKAPLYSQFLESIDGLITLRAFSWQENFQRLNNSRLDASQRPFYLLLCLQKWLSLVLDCFTAGFVLLIVGLIVGLRNKISPGFAGVALSNMISLSSLMSVLVMMWTQLETSIASVERVRDFQQETPSETDGVETLEPPTAWPDRGRIEVKNVTATYRDGATTALRNVAMDIHAGEKIGVCGRTGSGKTSLMLSLFRMINVSSGAILIDGIDIASVPPNRLRSALNAIPQEPYFLNGTIRENADPDHASSDEDIWRAISAVRLKGVIERKGGLDLEMKNDTLSHGEKQLFCLARAILRNCTIVVLDEATSNIDVVTERLIWQTVKEEFQDCTVITIAHRLDTILGCDRVAVLDAGELVEFDDPLALLERESRFKDYYQLYN